ncbi:MAG: hypothetical protein QHJ73_12825, partial [Armatimonadota bacterium]|nr:hypothetical protein [Armatimonadota bacterium]
GFLEGTTVRLTRAGEADVPASAVTVAPRLITAEFRVQGLSAGPWSVAVTTPTGQSATLNDALTVEEGGTPNVWLRFGGSSRLRVDRLPQVIPITFGNSGTAPAYDLLLFLYFSQGVTYEVRGLANRPTPPPGVSVPLGYVLDHALPNGPFSSGNDLPQVVPIWIYGLAQGSSRTLQLVITGVDLARLPFHSQFQMRAHLVETDDPSHFTSTGDWSYWPNHLNLLAACFTMLEQQWENQGKQVYRSAPQGASRQQSEDPYYGIPDDMREWATGARFNAHKKDIQDAIGTPTDNGVSYGLSTVATYAPAGKFGVGTNFVSALLSIFQFRTCGQIAKKILDERKQEEVFASYDPNDKGGPADYETPDPNDPTRMLRYTNLRSPFQYVINFENDPVKASAPVIEAQITDALDPSLNADTVALGPITFGNVFLTPPTGATSFEQDVDLRPARDVIVRVRAAVDAGARRITWSFTSLDPETGLVSEDDGFLPPNTADVRPAGEGTVSFYVRPNVGVASGTEIVNSAAIQFDRNPVMNTPEWRVIVDDAQPTSSVSAPAESRESLSFPVTWEGNDGINGSGVQLYNVYVSDNGGAWTLWLSETAAGTASFPGKFGHRYRFYSVAIDNVGNVESQPQAAGAPTAEAETVVGQPLPLRRGLAMVSFPLEPDPVDPRGLLGFQQNRWARWLPEAGSGGEYRYYPDPTTLFDGAVRGRAFWVLMDNPAEVWVPGNLVEDGQPYAIPLKKGWNQVGNPWLSPLTWDLSALQVRASGQTRPLRDATDTAEDFAWTWQQDPANPASGRYTMV